MTWENLSHRKKGLIMGLVIGLIFAFYSNVTKCHPRILGSGVSSCNNSFQVIIGIIEFLIYFPFSFLVSFLPFSFSVNFKILLAISPLTIFGLAGSLFGSLRERFKS